MESRYQEVQIVRQQSLRVHALHENTAGFQAYVDNMVELKCI